VKSSVKLPNLDKKLQLSFKNSMVYNTLQKEINQLHRDQNLMNIAKKKTKFFKLWKLRKIDTPEFYRLSIIYKRMFRIWETIKTDVRGPLKLGLNQLIDSFKATLTLFKKKELKARLHFNNSSSPNFNRLFLKVLFI
jgi:hypothetical protein